MIPLYTVKGTVISGQKRGKKLGFPTANVEIVADIPEGIYASELQVDKKIHLAATFIGSAKTFHEGDVKAESYILDFNQDIYGKKVTIWLYQSIRENKEFSSVSDLVTQIKKDVAEIRNFFSVRKQ